MSEKAKTGSFILRRVLMAVAGAVVLALGGCGSPPATPPDPVEVDVSTTSPTTTLSTVPTTTTVSLPPPPPPPAPIETEIAPPPQPEPAPEPAGNCDPAYPSVCIPSGPDLDCPEVSYKDFQVLEPDPHGFDRDNDGVGCES